MYFSYFIFRNLANLCITNKLIFPLAINNKDCLYLKSIILITVSLLCNYYLHEYITSCTLNYALMNQKYIIFFFRFYLFIFRKGKGERKRGRGTSVCGCLSLLGTWPTAQACALTGNRTSNPLVLRPALNPLSHTNQG